MGSPAPDPTVSRQRRARARAGTDTPPAPPTAPAADPIGPQPPSRRTRKELPPAETGRPESAREFSKRIRRVVLRVRTPGQQEGGNSPQSPSESSAPTPDRPADSSTPAGDSTQAPSQLETSHEEGRLVDHIAAANDGIHLESELRGRYAEDPFFGAILTNPRQFKNFTVKADGLVFLRDRNRELLCIPHILVNGRSVREIVITHAHSLLAHLGASKTNNLLRDHVWWKS
ncbi:hypothetical protein OH77DRAFT_1405778, partial [Trametes cingulata]